MDAHPDDRPDAHRLSRSDERFRLAVESIADYAILMLDPQGVVLTWNAGATRLKGYREQEIVGQSFERFYPADAVAVGWPREELRRAARDGSFEDEGWRVRKDGSRFWASVVITALRDPAGELLGYAKVTRDLSERRRQEEALRDSEEQFRLLVDSVKDYAIFMLDTEGRVQTWNSGASLMIGYLAHEVLGRDFAMFFTAAEAASGAPGRELATARRSGRADAEGWRVRKDGSAFWARAVLTPMYGRDGSLRGFAKVTRDLSEQRRLVELEHASKRTSEFLAMLAHELRNPLAPIRNAVSILQMQKDLSPMLQRTGQIIDRQLGQLTRLVDDLLDVGRIVTGKILLKLERVDYREVVLTSIEAVRPLATEHGHRLALDLPPQPIEMLGDATRLVQSLQNLLHNAVRYTPDGGEISVEVRVEGLSSITTVRDNGRGIAPDALERIFELFVQEDAAPRTRSESGLGIGLSLARTLVEQHGGILSAESAGLNRGSTFTMLLPLRPAPARAGAEAAGAGALERARRVLVVDDNRDSADTMVHVLGLLGHEARAAYGAAQAAEVAAGFAPQVVLLDLNMPDGDGFAVMRQLRAQSAQPLYIAAMTGYGQKEDRASTLEAGFQAHLTKPIGAEQLRQTLRDAATFGAR